MRQIRKHVSASNSCVPYNCKSIVEFHATEAQLCVQKWPTIFQHKTTCALLNYRQPQLVSETRQTLYALFTRAQIIRQNVSELAATLLENDL